MYRIIKFIGWYIALSVAAILGMLVLAFPDYPNTQSGWLWFFVLALPVTLVGDLIGEFTFRNRVAQAILEKSQGKAFSSLRILYGLIAMLILFGIVWTLAMHFGVNKV
ncbi:hypothetical protein [Collimonas sp. OK412]|jgi:hypothetical protein|uniref:hypothetical protein n=1 Tax=Collimonas sp. (strain OK412) TaxID=1801619 RepID=UPI000B80D9A9|nr:hypothetical protein [Collimonas sp. OK412]